MKFLSVDVKILSEINGEDYICLSLLNDYKKEK